MQSGIVLLYIRDAKPAVRRPDPAPEGVLSGPRSRLKKYKKLLLNDGDFINEFKLHRTANNFCNLLQSEIALIATISKNKQ